MRFLFPGFFHLVTRAEVIKFISYFRPPSFVSRSAYTLLNISVGTRLKAITVAESF